MTTWPEGVGRERLAAIDSTNAEALRRAARGETGPLWILADRQTAARGRRGRGWVSPSGNFAATLLMPMPGPPAVAAQRSFVAALGLLDALFAVTGRGESFAIKWPNDVLLEGRKLAGILLETGPGALVIGFGVNLAVTPETAVLERGAVAPVALRAATGLAIAPDSFLDLLAPAVDAWERLLQREGFVPIRAAWLGCAARLGTTIVARLPGRTLEGRFETIDASGALVLTTAEGRVSLPAADVYFAMEPADAARD